MEAHELKSRVSVSSRPMPKDSRSVRENDNAHLQRMGKKPVLKRNFGVISIFGFSCTILGTWEGLLGTFVRPLQNGGSAGAIYAFIFAWVGTASVFVVLAELASMAPTAGGQYHWAAMLAPVRYQKFLSYMTGAIGWLAVLGWQTGLASLAFLTGTTIQGAAILGNSHYEAFPWHGTLLVWAALVFALVANLAGGKVLPRVETMTLVAHIVGFFGILIPLTYMSEQKSPQELFSQFSNGGGFPTQGLAWFMAEEVENASRVIPLVTMLTVGINGCLGFGILLAILFCDGNIQEALDSSTGYPFMWMFHQATNSIPGSLAMCAVVIVNFCCSLVGMLAATSRQLWSFSRDKGTPGWQFWSQVTQSERLPANAIILTALISILLALINIGSSVALDDILSMAVSGIYLSYLMVATLLFRRRLRGEISSYNTSDEDIVNVPGAKLVWGPFHCPGIWGILVNGFAMCYIFIVVFFSFWPSKVNPSPDEMNWSVMGVGCCIILGLVYYFVRARHVYTGPIRELAI
ncbi:amino acid permease [Penicillium capsulatum]|uniref:Amino acid permease n=1 Tax=Penicillium capsulatum TaxID=69766 RepID=A0A9W9LGG1_9EURO|nr:amino acid permease [Penicillium capsulatum]